MSDKKNADHTDRLSPEELFERFSDDSFSSLLTDDSVWGQNLPSDFSFNDGEESDDAWGRDGIGDSADLFGLADISSGFGNLSSDIEETHTAEETGKFAAEADSWKSVSGLSPSQSGDTDRTDESSLIRDFLHKDLLSEEHVGEPDEDIIAEDAAVSEYLDISMAKATATDELITAGVDVTQPAARPEAETALWLMRIMINNGNKQAAWDLRKRATGIAGDVIWSKSPFSIKMKLIGVTIMPHIYFAMLKGRNDQ